jgi:hypothetical protein
VGHPIGKEGEQVSTEALGDLDDTSRFVGHWVNHPLPTDHDLDVFQNEYDVADREWINLMARFWDDLPVALRDVLTGDEIGMTK